MALGMHYFILSGVRFLQFVLAITVCGLYGVDLHHAAQVGGYSDSKWVYAEVVGALSAFKALIYMIPFIISIPFIFIWDSILFFMWIVLFGIFGNLFIHENPEGDGGIQRMKNAVWVDLVNALLWLITAVAMALYWRRNRQARTVFTGRAQDHV